MPYVQVPKDLSKVKTKLAFNLTKRQLICFSGAAAVGIPVYLLTRPVIGSSPALFLMIGLMLPFFFFAMFERDGLPFEKILRNYIRARFLWPQVRPYKTENFYAAWSGPRRFGPSWPEAGGHTERRYQDCEKEKR
ncbi:MAG: PrgI family protein [Enterocloster bolteae]